MRREEDMAELNMKAIVVGVLSFLWQWCCGQYHRQPKLNDSLDWIKDAAEACITGDRIKLFSVGNDIRCTKQHGLLGPKLRI